MYKVNLICFGGAREKTSVLVAPTWTFSKDTLSVQILLPSIEEGGIVVASQLTYKTGTKEVTRWSSLRSAPENHLVTSFAPALYVQLILVLVSKN